MHGDGDLAKMSVHKSIFRNITCEFQASERDQLNADKLMTFVRKAGRTSEFLKFIENNK